MTLPASGIIKFSDLVTEFGGSTPHSISEYYRGAGLTTTNNTNVPASGAIDLSDFFNGVKAVPGSQDYTTPGTYSFTVLPYQTLTIEVWGAGGSGGSGFNGPNGYTGGSSTITELGITAGGGLFGYSRNNGAAGGAGGTASGGNTTNWNGEAGNVRSYSVPAGGRDGYRLGSGLEPTYSGDPYGTPYGGGGRAGYGNGVGGGGGGGAYAKSILTPGDVAVGSSLTIVVGTGGAGRYDALAGEGGAGANGRIYLVWT